MAIIKSGATSDQLTVDPTSKAARVTLYDTTGNALPATPVTGTVSVSNFPATQPISGTVTANVGSGTQPVSGTVSVSNFPATQPVSGSFFQATQPVSASSLPLPTGAATSAAQASMAAQLPAALVGGRFDENTGSWMGSTAPTVGSKTSANSLPVVIASDQSTVPVSIAAPVNPTPVTLAVSVTGVSGAAVTLTLPAIAGQFHYISLVEIVKYGVAAITGSATPVVVTTTNLPGSLAFTFDTAAAIGTTVVRTHVQALPLKSSVVNTATTIVCPATTSVIWRINVYYYGAP